MRPLSIDGIMVDGDLCKSCYEKILKQKNLERTIKFVPKYKVKEK
jgi:hypothetical protein